MEELKLSEQEIEAWSLLKSLGFISVAKKTEKTDFGAFVRAIHSFRTTCGLNGFGVDEKFMKQLDFVAQIEKVGPYSPDYADK